MKNKTTFSFLTIAFSLFGLTACSSQNVIIQDKTTDVSMFPKAKENEQKVVLQLPTLENENDYKIEIYGGKNMKVDCNQHVLAGEFTSHDLAGWGYNYYKFTTSGEVMTTLMACPNNTMKDAFVTAQPTMLPYNSRMPYVIYAPKGYEIQYKVWSSSGLKKIK